MVTNSWKPDTCGCVIEFEFDADASEDVRVHTGKRVVKACDAHDEDAPAVHYGKLLNENVGKNRVMKAILDALPADQVKFDAKGERMDFKVQPTFSFDSDRKLKITLDASHPKNDVATAVTKDHPDVVIE